MRKNQIYFSVLSVIALMGIICPVVFQTNLIYTHFFYIAIALTTIWYPGYAILVGFLFAAEHVVVEFLISGNFNQIVLLRACIIVFVSIVLSKICNMQKQYEQEIYELSYDSQHDSLTRLYNRRYFYNYLQNELSMPLAVFICDMDHLKEVNDKYGHAVGDMLIVEMSDFLSSLFRPGCVVARLGGDEFGIVMQNCNENMVIQCVEEIRTELQAFNQTKEPYLRISFSIGYAVCEDRRYIYEAMMQADRAMYQEKMEKKEVKKE